MSRNKLKEAIVKDFEIITNLTILKGRQYSECVVAVADLTAITGLIAQVIPPVMKAGLSHSVQKTVDAMIRPLQVKEAEFWKDVEMIISARMDSIQDILK